jgi:hypothetical protein
MDGAKQECIDKISGLGCTAIRVLGVEQTGGVDPNVTSGESGVNLYNVSEDDSKDFEKQETGDDSSGAEAENKDSETPSFGATETQEHKADDSSSDSDKTETTDDMRTDGISEPKQDDAAGKDDSTDEKSDSEEEEKDDGEQSKQEPSEGEPKKLTSDEKTSLREEYTRVYKDVLKKTNLGKSFVDMTIQEKMDFLKTLSEKWTKNDPTEFLSDKEFEKLNKTVVKTEEDSEEK